MTAAPLRELDDEQERDVVIGRALSVLDDTEVLLLTAAKYRRTADANGRVMWRDPVEGGARTQAEAVARVRREHRR